MASQGATPMREHKMRDNGHSTNGSSVTELTPKQAKAFVDREAKAMVGVPAKEAFKKLDRGELKGTLAEARLSLLRRFVTK